MHDDGEAKRDEAAPRADNRPKRPAETPPNGDEIASEAGPPPGPAGFDSALGAAILRINASLDLDTVLAEVVESARALTGARWGVIATIDEAGAPLDFVFSGFTPEEELVLAAWPDSARLFAQFRDLPGPLRVADLSDYVRALGIEPAPMFSRSFQGTPMRYRGAGVGSFFLADKADGEAFTEADEATLALFASQAASAIVNAHTHRDEQRARADLEALVETCPVGVAVLDAAAGAAVSLNREARRLLSGLESADGSPGQLREVVCRRGDGHEVTLGDLAHVEMVRAEEVELSVPDGASARVLIDATPIRSGEDSAVERVVVTLQDLEPFEALERSRAEFLGLVSHELRAPLAAIKGSAAALGDPRDPDRAELRQYLRIVEEQADRMSGLIGDLLDAGLIGAGMLSVDPAPEDLAGLVERARTAFAAGGGAHAVTVELPEDLPRVMADARRIAQVLNNLFANAAHHSPETAPVRVAAQRHDAVVEVSVTDAGEGIPANRLPHLFRRHAGIGPGGESNKAGERGSSGLGLVICRGLVEAHGGRIRAESGGPGRGARIVFTLPVADESAASVTTPPAREAAERTKVLVVDDDPHALRHARDALAAAGYAPAATAEPGEIPRLVETKRPALVVLDLVLPGVDGIELMRTLPALADLPVIFVSAYGGGDTIARALEAGAADYIVKPYSPAELAARVGLALRRRTAPGPFRIGDLEIDRAKRRVTVAGRAVRLTATEYRVLHALSVDAGGATTFEDLLRRVWGPGKGDPQAVRSAVTKLRRKLGDDARNPRYILGERGMGYRMPEPD